MIKIDSNFNFNILLKLFFSLSKKSIFFSPILANNNLPLKIYYESIVKILWYHFLFFLFFSFFFPSFFILHTRTAFLLFFFLFFFFFTHISLHFSLFTSFLFCNLPLPPNSKTFQLSFFLFFFFFGVNALLVPTFWLFSILVSTFYFYYF